MAKQKEKEVEHAVHAAYYGGPGEPYFQPVMSCDCGFETERCPNWEEAGRQMDAHLELVEKARIAQKAKKDGHSS